MDHPFPSHLPILQLHNRVVLPHTYARVEISRGEGGEQTSFLEECLSASKSAPPPLIGVLPVLSTGTKGQAQGEDVLLPLDSSGRAIGTAARILQISRQLQAGHFVVVLEGLGRVAISDAASLHLETLEPFDKIKVTQLEPVKGFASQAGLVEDAAADEEELTAMGTKVKKAMVTFVKLVTQRAGAGNSAAKRLMDTLDKLPPWQAADVVGSALSSTVEDRLAVLHCLHHMDRLGLALHRARRAVEVARSGGSSSASPTTAANSSNPTRVVVTVPQKGPSGHVEGKEEGADDDDDDDDDDLNALAARLRAARPPPDILKAAMKEVKRMRRAGEAQPSYLASRAYIEVLAELPWKRTSASSAATAGSTMAGSTATTSSTVTDIGKRAVGRGPEVEPTGPMPLAEARTLLDRQHYGLDKVKDRVVEYLAVLRLRGTSARAPILCFIGPPGVGKTSLAQSVAQVLGRPFVRIALGGVRDEAEVRGHRRTYIGAMPGRVIQGLRRAGVCDPVMLLDEVDKLGKDSLRGDPASALLEVLDPEQNQHFTDTYLGVPFDLTQVTFVATANRASDIPAPLLDRMEVIQLNGYTLEEKVHIARVHLMPRLLVEHGLAALNHVVDFPDPVISYVAEGYTREAGVRSLSRGLAAICRHLAVAIVAESELKGTAPTASPPAPQGLFVHPSVAGGQAVHGAVHMQAAAVQLSSTDCMSEVTATSDTLLGEQPHASVLEYLACDVRVTTELVEKVLGPPPFELGGAKASREKVAAPGAATGLVWTAVGGAVQYIECVKVSCGAPDRPGSLTLTGQVGEVLQESCQLALSWIRAHAQELGLVSNTSSAAVDDAASLACNCAAGGIQAGMKAVQPIATSSQAGGGLASTSVVQLLNPASSWDIHIHLPSGSIPKDGPSAGITLACALLSLLSGRCLRADTAMTGELTLRGLVLPVGGVKEKLLAASHAGLARVIIPARCMRDVEVDLPASAREALAIIPVETLTDVLLAAFDPPYLLLPRARL